MEAVDAMLMARGRFTADRPQEPRYGDQVSTLNSNVICHAQ
jgi:hypothetical protein